MPNSSTAPKMMAAVPQPLPGPGLKASITSLPTEEGLGHGLDVAGVEEGALDAVLEADGVPEPGEPVGQDHLALGAHGNAGQVDDRPHPIAHVDVELGAGVARQRVRLPGAHEVSTMPDPPSPS